MRPALMPETPLEALGLLLNRVPVPAAHVMFGMAVARTVMAGQRLGIFRALCDGPATSGDLATRLGAQEQGTRLLLDCLCALGHIRKSRGVYRLAAHSRRWLETDSRTLITGFLEFNFDQWEWWSQLEEALISGKSAQIHATSDPAYWERYITAMFELARISGPEIAGRIRLPRGAARILDVGGGHGWFSAELCRRYPEAEAIVIDLPQSCRVGREIIAREGLSDRVRHVEGDFLSHPLDGPYDAALCFQIIHHLSAEENRALLSRLREALVPRGTLAVMDYFGPAEGERPGSAAFLGLHFYLSSGAAVYSADDLVGWTSACGFSRMRTSRIRSLPVQTLLQFRAADA